MKKRQNDESSLMIDGTHPEPLVFDREAFFGRTMNNLELARKVIDIFLGDMSACLDNFRAYVETKDYDNISWYAHRIKGASANVGGMALSSSAAEIERAAIECEYDKIVSSMSELEKQYDLLVDQIKEV